MAAAIRSMLGKMGNRRPVTNTMTPFKIRILNVNHIQDMFPVTNPPDFFSGVHRPRIQRSLNNVGYLGRRLEKYFPQMRYVGAGPINNYSRKCPRSVINAHFALEEFNKQKNSQLQFVRVVEAYDQWCESGLCDLLTLETIDSNNVIQIYQTIVKENLDSKSGPQLLLFGLVADNGNGSLLKLIDNRCREHQGPIDNRRAWQSTIQRLHTRKRYPLEEEILSTLHTLPLS